MYELISAQLYYFYSIIMFIFSELYLAHWNIQMIIQFKCVLSSVNKNTVEGK